MSYTYPVVTFLRARALALLFLLFSAAGSLSSVYNGRPRLIVVIVVDQLRGDMLERYRDQFTGGFHTFLERGAVFSECYFDYANTRTAPGHATLFTGAYSNAHGIIGNEWWDPVKKKAVSSVLDESTRIVGLPGAPEPGASPHYLLADTLGDELKLATAGRSRVYAIALKDRAAVLPGGYAANAAFWIDKDSGAFLTSSYYMNELPAWAAEFNRARRAGKYWNLEWKDASGKVMGTTAPRNPNGGPPDFYDIVGSTPFANDYELEFARELIVNEKLGSGPATDMLAISISSYDLLGHQFGPDSSQMAAMTLALDRQLGEFIAFLGRQLGLANVWLALSADHGIAPVPAQAAALRLPARGLDAGEFRAQLNAALASRFFSGRGADFFRLVDWPVAYLSQEAFAALNLSEADAERAVGEALVKVAGARGFFTRAQLVEGQLPQDDLGRKYLHSYSSQPGWFVMAVPSVFMIGARRGTDHSAPYSYDTHVPLAFLGLPFRPGTYRAPAEPVDMAPTLASLLGINKPTHAAGRVLTEALAEGPGKAPAADETAPR